jgi:hypothetical protein
MEQQQQQQQRRAAVAPVTNFTHVATYQAHYQVIRHTLCTGSALPVLRLVCDGPHIQLVQTSHASIQCDTLLPNDSMGSAATTATAVSGGATLVCTNTCNDDDDECRSVFLATHNDNNPATSTALAAADGPWGRVTFQCLSNTTVTDLEAQVTMSEDESGASLSSSCVNPSNERSVSVLHLLRLGVQCPHRNRGSSNENDDGTVYTYDDYYFECRSSVAIAGYDNNMYTCLFSNSCDGVGCTATVPPLSVLADVDLLLQNQCLTAVPATAPTVAQLPTLAPRIGSSTAGKSAQFEAGWGMLVEDETDLTCASSTTARITCLDGTLLSMVYPVFETVLCTTTSRSMVECSDTNPSHFQNRFTGLIYVSIHTTVRAQYHLCDCGAYWS